jgi:hypothetical protein
VRGFPKKAAGEDFYLLNKIVKIGIIQPLSCPLIKIQARLSERVPFGTGSALIQINKLNDPLNDYYYYHPQTFTYLKCWLTLIPQLWSLRKRESPFLEKILFLSPQYAQILCCVLTRLRIEKVFYKAYQQSQNLSTFMRYIHTWFDGLRTLQFIHYLEQHYFSSQNWEKTVEKAIFLQYLREGKQKNRIIQYQSHGQLMRKKNRQEKNFSLHF